MYYINYDEETGDILGIYPSTEAFDDVPSPKITITDEELEVISNGYYIVQNGELVEAQPPEYNSEDDNPPAPPIDNNGSGSDIDTNTSIKQLQSAYAQLFAKLKTAYLGAAIMEDNNTAEAIQADYRTLLNEFTRKVIDIEASNPITTNDYCEICGTQTVDGICPNCRWRQ